jgi:hypothetical protein
MVASPGFSVQSAGCGVLSVAPWQPDFAFGYQNRTLHGTPHPAPGTLHRTRHPAPGTLHPIS